MLPLMLLLLILLMQSSISHGTLPRVTTAAAFDRKIFCEEIASGSSAQFCADRAFAERGDVTSGTVAMVAVQEARDAALKVCNKAFEYEDIVTSTSSSSSSHEAIKSRAKAASDDTARRLCEQMSRLR